MKKIIFLFLPLFLFSKDIEVQIKGVDSTLGGNLRIKLLKAGQEFPTEKNPFRKLLVSADKSEFVFKFENLPESDYAIMVHHDENSNGQVDKYWFGMPKEGFGLSNNFKPKFSRPNFDDVKFSNSLQTITMNY